MKGFFKKDGAEISSAPSSLKKIGKKKEITDPCSVCGLNINGEARKSCSGTGNKKILIVTDFPLENHRDRFGWFNEDVEKSLQKALHKKGYDLYEDFWITGALSCPIYVTKPTRKQMKLCKVKLEKTIKVLKPDFIWLFGADVVSSFYMDRFSTVGINLWRKRLIPDYNHNCFVIPMYHPRNARSNMDDNVFNIFLDDVDWALSCLNKKLPPSVDIDDVLVLKTGRKIISALQKVIDKKSRVVFDYETSSLNAHLPNPRIWTVGFNGFSFGLDHPDVILSIDEKEMIEKLWCDILTDSKIPKIAHNVKFEDIWSRKRFGVIPDGWVHDTMITQHIVEYRPTSMALKFQSFVKWGVPEYEQEMKKYMNDEWAENKLNMMPLNNLCVYNAIDTLLTEKLWKCQIVELEKSDGLKKANDLFFDGVLAFCDIESEGICVDDEWYKTRSKELGREIKMIEHRLVNGVDGKKFRAKMGRDIKISSNKDLTNLFFDILKLNSEKKTAGGNPSVDVGALSAIKSSFVENLLRYRKLIKIKDTYLSQFIKGSVGGKIHPSFLLHTVATYRSSSASPNFQNIPVRDEEAKFETRSGIIPSKGNKLLEIDYAAQEVRLAACYTKDPALIKYINDPKSDMHTDQAKNLFIASDDEVSKDMRFYAKNGFVFPEIYGSSYVMCSRNIWDAVKEIKTKTEIPLIDHLKKQGILNEDQFTDHVRDVEQVFWNTFPKIKEWGDKNADFYQRKGYIQFLFGHRRGGYLSRNALANYPIQGCLNKESLVQTNKGWIPIKKLVGKQTKVWTGFKWANAVGLEMGECQLAEIVLDSGIVIKCDTRHKLKNEKGEWVNFENLKKGSFVCLPQLPKRISDVVPNPLSWDFVMGYFYGDGYYKVRKISEQFTRKSLTLFGGLKKHSLLVNIDKFFLSQGLSSNIYTSKFIDRADKYKLCCEGKRISSIFQEYGIEKTTNAHTKRIPSKIWEGTQKQQMDFMMGLWLSDGGRDGYNKYSLHMCNRLLLEDVQKLLFGLGYDSIITKTKTGWKLFVREVFDTKIIRSRRKVPRSVFDSALSHIKIEYQKGDNEAIVDRRMQVGDGDVSQNIFERMIKKYNPNFPLYRYDKIKSIKKIRKKEITYTMSVDDDLHQFVADGVITKNSAFHCLLWSLIQLNRIRKEERWKTRIIGQIHDSIIFDLYPKEEKKVLKTATYIMTKAIRMEFPFLIVPLEVEAEITEINDSWYTKKKIKGSSEEDNFEEIGRTKIIID